MYSSIPFSSIPGGAGEPVDLRARRVTAEVISISNEAKLHSRRVLVEVISDNPFVPTSRSRRATRVLAEVVGLMAPYAGRRSRVSRAVAEVISPSAPQGHGLKLPNLVLENPTALAILRITTSAGSWHLGDGSQGLTVAWKAGQTRITWGYPGYALETTITTPSGAFLLTVTGSEIRINGVPQATAGFASPFGVLYDQMGLARTDEYPDGASLGELMLLNRQLTGPELTLVEAYMTCKWLDPGCNPETDL